MKHILSALLIFIPCIILAQTVTQKLQTTFSQFEKDPQLAYAISSLYVIDANTGKVVFEKNARVGLAPASTQKIITSVSAFELLKKDFRYKTILQSTGEIKDSVLQGNLNITGSGDPTFGSNRYNNTKSFQIINAFVTAIQKKGIKQIVQPLSFNYKTYSNQAIPDGWIMQDIGNYYGAPASVLNWKENQFDIVLNSEKANEVKIISPTNKTFINELKTGPKGSGDNAYCYLPTQANTWVLTGSIPIGEQKFTIAAADNEPAKTMLTDFLFALKQKQIKTNGIEDYKSVLVKPVIVSEKKYTEIYSHYSPTLDSIVYWFNKKSINLYGEALLKTIGNNVKSNADSGIAVVKLFWTDKGIDKNELNIFDGSGLSPLNRVTTHAQVEILKYAASKEWYNYFLQALPIYNGMTMKSGSITNVKGFCGYHTAKDGYSYIFSFLVNNFNGKSGDVASKMFKVLDALK
ncbi:MAG: D-alanyl-D-alanine carboxypeptidase/D-alanyl-D-alanine-endopeptidase [Ferruginibacter sp.]|nr:D-alanyl-D-alanine carboxypeptidase/D-alanyl-D-alanine-endopeptidase [Ferruginibacter sp.]